MHSLRFLISVSYTHLDVYKRQSLNTVGDEIVDGLWNIGPRSTRPLALYDGLRVDYSLKRLMHYSGTDWQDFQPWILFTNYARYVDEFVRWAAEEIKRPDTPYYKFCLLYTSRCV